MSHRHPHIFISHLRKCLKSRLLAKSWFMSEQKCAERTAYLRREVHKQRNERRVMPHEVNLQVNVIKSATHGSSVSLMQPCPQHSKVYWRTACHLLHATHLSISYTWRISLFSNPFVHHKFPPLTSRRPLICSQSRVTKRKYHVGKKALISGTEFIDDTWESLQNLEGYLVQN